MTLMGLVHSWQGLYVVRFFLGLTEAGLFPGVNYYLSCWYKRKEFGIRAAIFFSAAALAGEKIPVLLISAKLTHLGSFGGLLAYGIQFMNGIGNKAGWAWIFILEGIFTVFIGIASFWMVHDFPDEAKFLKPDDRARVIRRLKVDKQASANHESFQMKYFWAAMKDYKTWLQCVIYMGCDGPLYCFSLFLPTIISTLGTWSPVQSQLLSVPPYALAAILTITVGYVADRTQQRGLCNIVMSLFGIAGFSMLLGSHTPGVQYAGTFLAAAGIYPCISNTITWGSNNFEGVYKRGVAIGVFIGWGNLNGIMASNVYLQREKPRFWTGHGVVIAYLTLFLLGGSITQHLVLKRENAARRAGKRDHTIEGLSEKEIEELGDKK